MDLANEITNALSTSVGNDVFDDDELLAELEELAQSDIAEKPQILPEAPSGGTKFSLKFLRIFLFFFLFF